MSPETIVAIIGQIIVIIIVVYNSRAKSITELKDDIALLRKEAEDGRKTMFDAIDRRQTKEICKIFHDAHKEEHKKIGK